MEAEWDIELLTGLPDPIVRGRIDVGNVAQVHWNPGIDDAAMTLCHGPLDLGRRCFGREEGNDALGNEPGAGRGPLLNQPIVVRLHARQLELGIGDAPKSLNPDARHARIEDAGRHPIRVHCPQPLGRIADGARHVDPALRLTRPLGHEGAAQPGTPEADWIAVDHPPLAAIGVLYQVRNAVSELFGEAAGPEIRWLLDVIVGADEAAS